MLKKIIRPGEPGYRQCTVTIMDTTDPDITFDEAGVSSWVHYFHKNVLTKWKPEGDQAALNTLMQRIKADGKGKEYDCALGLSGGVDSSYLAYIARREGLRPLVVHTDVGWNSDIAVRNIEKIVKSCGYELFTLVIDWDVMADLQRAFLRASVPNQDIPQDQVIFAAFYGFAAKHGIKWVLSGHNYACESVLPTAWGHNPLDIMHIKAIYRKFGKGQLNNYPLMSLAKYSLLYTLIRGMRVVKPLNLVPYNKAEAMQILEKEFGWQYYGGKHFESRWTRFFQGWWLPTRFGYDKRLAHLSSLIMSGQITRETALQEMKMNCYPQSILEEDKDLIVKKLGMSGSEWDQIMVAPVHSHDEYPSSGWIIKPMNIGRDILRRFSFLK